MGFQFKNHKRWSLASETLNQSLPNLTEKIYEQMTNLIKAHSYENKYLHILVQTMGFFKRKHFEQFLEKTHFEKKGTVFIKFIQKETLWIFVRENKYVVKRNNSDSLKQKVIWSWN